MVLLYAGTELLAPMPEVTARICANIDPSWLWEFTDRTWPGKGLESLPFRGYLPRGPARIGVLSWPQGASRWAYGHFLCDEVALTTIRQEIYPSGVWTADTLTIFDGRRKVECDLYCLPPRPLERVVQGVPGMYLITLVDHRFLWWFQSANLGLNGTQTFTQIYTAIGDALGVDIDADEIADAYPSTPGGLNVEAYLALPPLLDAVAACCGQRIVRRLDGTVLALNPLSSYVQMEANLASEAFAFEDGNLRIAGHEMDLKLAGGGGGYNLTAGP